MKKKIFSVLGILILGLNTVFCQAVSISYDSLDSQNGEFYIDDEECSQESLQESENLLEDENLSENENILENEEFFIFNNTQESSLEATEKNNLEINLLNLGDDISENLFIPEDLNYTTVDITDVFTGSIISHDCNMYLISNFDETEHWNECSVCGKILNKEEHAYVDSGWTGGSASNCSEKNVHLFTCECGSNYSNIEGRKAHNFSYVNSDSAFSYYASCKTCQNEEAIHDCIKEDGSRLDCLHLGKCSLCGYTYTATNRKHQGTTEELGSLYCPTCNKYLGELLEYNLSYASNGNIVFYANVQLPSGYSSLTYSSYQGANVSKVSLTHSGLSQTYTAKFSSTHMEYQSYMALFWNFTLDGEKCVFRTSSYCQTDRTPPVITNIISNTEDWTTDSTISITGTENYCNSVNLTLKDTKGNIYAENITASVNNGNWNYEIKPSLESQDNTEFILQVKDTLDNTTEQNFYISKIDAIPPKTVETEALNTEWSKTKDYIFISSDYGIGQVQNSVISTDNYEPATENENIFYKGYTFTGDVYGETFVPVYMKDGLNNQNVEFVKVSNLDNTAPSIEEIILNKTLHNTEVVISANDINDKLNATGSGVTGYAISTENKVPDSFQEENTFNISESGKYYLFVTDLVGNVTSKEIYIPVKYKVTINPDGGTWKGNTFPQDFETDEPINLYPEPEKDGYTFKEWKIDGEASINEDGDLIIEGDVTVTPIWEANQYLVTFIDYDVTHNRIINTTTREFDFNAEISGTYLGSDETDNVYYPQYRLVSDTSVIISTNPENNVVYRYFEFCYTEKESHINFNDDNNKDGLRPETYKLQLTLEDGQLIDEVTLPTTEPDYTFTNLSKYDEQGEEYIYKIIPIISDRYTPTEPDGDGNTTVIYNNPECSINIPKTTTLDGKNGNLTYTIQIDTNLFYKDKIIIIPEENVTLTDGVKNMIATITQDKTEFTKDDELKITGRIQTTKKHFAGTWKGIFNFKIKYEVSN